jgi:Domain of Unknown Function (DUF1080)
MYKILMIACAAALLLACNGGDNNKPEEKKDTVKIDSTLNIVSDEDKADGWISLFDGTTTKGWHRYGKMPAGKAWQVKDGAIMLDISNKDTSMWQLPDGGDLVTDEEFENFHLKLEWKISKGGNSGIVFFSHEDTTKYEWSWETGLEMQVLDNDGHDDGKIPKHRAGDLYDLISCSKETVKPVGEWNQVEVRAMNGKLDLFLNGTNVVSTTIGDDNWKSMLKNSKWKEHKDFSTYKKGRIALQDHGNTVWYRNIRIKKL